MDIFIDLLIILVSIFLSIFLFLIFAANRSPPINLPPSPYKLPLIGNLHNLILTGSIWPHRALRSLALKYGPLMHLQLGELSLVIVSLPDAAEQVLKVQDINFAMRHPIISMDIASYGCENSVAFSPYGDYWRQGRKIFKTELLSLKRVQSFRSIRERVFLDLMRWISACKEGSPINLTKRLYSSTYAVVSTTVSGTKAYKEKEALILSALEECIVLGGRFHVADLYPSIKLLQMITGLRYRLRRGHKKIDRIFEEVINEHKSVANYTDDDNGVHEKDMIDVLLKLQDDDGLRVPLTNDNLKALLVDILSAGSETSATTLDWAMAEILKNPRVYEKAQDEVREVFDDKGYVDESNIHQLKYLKAVIKETLRLHPSIPLIPRKCRQACQINGYEIPVNTVTLVNAWAINRDPRYWKNADCFQPERFLDSLVDYRGNHIEYIPFGSGRRICPGMSFGLANVELALAMLLYHFDWKLPAGVKPEQVSMMEGIGATARRIKSLYAIPVIKRPLPVK